MAFFGAELRRARVAAGMSQDQLGRELSFSGDLVGKIETCERAPTRDFATGCDSVFPHLDGLFSRLMELARRWDGPYPQWFRDWLEAEREALSPALVGADPGARLAPDRRLRTSTVPFVAIG
jgi:transcriptional regulator with XRE-family HTH domain